MDKFVLWDDIYKNEEGRLYTKTWMDNSPWHRDKHTWEKVEGYSIDAGTSIRCVYSQLFFPNSSLLLCNDIVEVDDELYDNLENGELWHYYDAEGNEVKANDGYESEEAVDIYQYYLIDNQTAEILMHHTDEIVFWCEPLGLYVLGVTHFGTMWCGVDAEYVV